MATEPAPPVLIGGVGRSGTHVLGRLAGAAAGLRMFPRECVFHAHPKGLAGVLRGEVEPAAFVRRLRGDWWRRSAPWDGGVERGLFKSVPPERFEAAVAAFERDAEDPVAAGRALMTALLGPGGWVEMTPGNAAAAPELRALFPELRLVHVVRDGRDVACSLVPLPWGPSTLPEALAYWEANLRRAHAGAAALPAEQMLAVQLEHLLLTDREAAFGRLAAFLGRQDDPGMRGFFEREVTAERGHLGRWRAELTAAQQDEITRLYVDALTRLRTDGVASAPPLAVLPEGYGGVAWAASPPTVDPWADGRAADA